jgi:hypothetical protein
MAIPNFTITWQPETNVTIDHTWGHKTLRRNIAPGLFYMHADLLFNVDSCYSELNSKIMFVLLKLCLAHNWNLPLCVHHFSL